MTDFDGIHSASKGESDDLIDELRSVGDCYPSGSILVDALDKAIYKLIHLSADKAKLQAEIVELKKQVPQSRTERLADHLRHYNGLPPYSKESDLCSDTFFFAALKQNYTPEEWEQATNSGAMS